MTFTKYEFKNNENKDYWYDEEAIAKVILCNGITEESIKEYNEACIINMEANVMNKMENDTLEWKLRKGDNHRYINPWFKYIPKEVYPNIVEWINNEPISKIKYKELSIKELFDRMRLPDNIKEKYYSVYYFKALRLLARYVEGGCIDKESYLFSASISYYTI